MTVEADAKKPVTEKVRIAKMLERARKEAQPSTKTLEAIEELSTIWSVDELRLSDAHAEGPRWDISPAKLPEAK